MSFRKSVKVGGREHSHIVIDSCESAVSSSYFTSSFGKSFESLG
jgi:hypothetical protein